MASSSVLENQVDFLLNARVQPFAEWYIRRSKNKRVLPEITFLSIFRIKEIIFRIKEIMSNAKR